ncbi:MAG: hypothetical protein H0U98_07790 [Alphaproteobacteria bacterium]|nr:hypothetical protein [Alphaproteobacteria bacterium]
MGYRIQVFQSDDNKLLDLASNVPLADTREDAVEAITMLKAEYALILDTDGQLIDRLKRSA